MSNQETDNPHTSSTKTGWERELVEKLAFASLNEQRRARKWGIFFKIFFGVYLLLLLILSIPLFIGLSGDGVADRAQADEHTALVNLDGIITSNSPASADLIVSSLRDAFKNKNSKGVIIRSNSPGGSPVQSAYIYNEIKRLRKLYPKKPIYAVIVDVCASGCYYAIAGTNKIYANESSIVGSIGVLFNSFGFVGAMKKLGIERRLITAGERKGILDPYSPLDAYSLRHTKKMLGQVHTQFINAVKEGRGEALSKNKDLFSGLFWSGSTAKALGLVDYMGSASYVAREVIKAENIVDYTYRPRFIDRFIRKLGVSIANAFETRFLMNTVPGSLR